MKVIKQGQNAPVDRTTDSIFYGDRVEGQTIVGKGASKDFSFNTVTFFEEQAFHFSPPDDFSVEFDNDASFIKFKLTQQHDH